MRTILKETLRIQIIGMLDFNGIVQFLEEASCSSIELSNDLDDNTFLCNRVDRLESFTSTQMEDSISAKEQDKTLFGIFCHSL